MEQITLRLSENTLTEVETEAEEADVPRSKVLRDAIESRHEHEEELNDLREEVDELRTDVERLRNEKRALIDDREERADLVAFAEQEKELKELEREARSAPVWTRAKWWIVGRDVDD